MSSLLRSWEKEPIFERPTKRVKNGILELLNRGFSAWALAPISPPKKEEAVVSAANESENGVCNCRKVLWSFKFKIVKSKEEEDSAE